MLRLKSPRGNPASKPGNTSSLEMHDGIPVLRGVIVGAQLKIACPFCRYRGRPVYHWHGWGLAAGPGVLGHRMAHCHDANSPFDKGGYYIGVAPVSGSAVRE